MESVEIMDIQKSMPNFQKTWVKIRSDFKEKKKSFRLSQHPLLSVFLLWLFFFIGFGWFQMDGDVTVSYIGTMGMAGTAAYFWARKRERARHVPKEKQKALLYMLGAVLFTGAMMFAFFHIPSNIAIHSRNEMVPFFFLTAAAVVYCIVLSVRKKWSDRRIIMAMLYFSCVVHLFFMMTAKYNVTNLDMGEFFGNGTGHAGYIEYLYEHGLIPAQFHPKLRWQYYHPPFHHIIQAILLKIETLCGVDIRVAVKNVQFLNLLYTMLSKTVAYLIFRQAGLRKRPLALATAVMAFTPAMMYVGILINNDMLSILFIFLCVLLTMRWYKKPSMKNIIKIAVCFGLGMFTKMSVALAAPSIAVIFIAVLIGTLRKKEFRTFGGYMGQMGVFLVIAAPISVYWSLRNYFRFGLPLGYVPQSLQPMHYIPNSAFQRLTDFNFSQLYNPYFNLREYDCAYNEYNPLIGLLKCASTEFGTMRNISGLFAGYAALWTTIIVAAIALIMMVCVLVKKKTFPGIYKLFFAVLYIVYLASYYDFCINYPYICTQHIRYAMPLILIGALFIGLGIKELSHKKSVLSKAVIYGTSGAVIVFSVTTVLILVHYGITVTIGMM